MGQRTGHNPLMRAGNTLREGPGVGSRTVFVGSGGCLSCLPIEIHRSKLVISTVDRPSYLWYTGDATGETGEYPNYGEV